mgnify:CR=1 FL=1
MKLVSVYLLTGGLFLASCAKKEDYAPFENILNTSYLKLNGPVKSVEISFAKAEIKEKEYGGGYYEETSATLTNFNFHGVKTESLWGKRCGFYPLYEMFYDNVSNSGRADIDIYFKPIQYIKQIMQDSPYAQKVQFNFTPSSFIDSVIWKSNNKISAIVNIDYEKNMFIRQVKAEQFFGLSSDPNKPLYREFTFNDFYKYDYTKKGNYLIVNEQCNSQADYHVNTRTYIIQNKNIKTVLNDSTYYLTSYQNGKPLKTEYYKNGEKAAATSFINGIALDSCYVKNPLPYADYNERNISYNKDGVITKYDNIAIDYNLVDGRIEHIRDSIFYNWYDEHNFCMHCQVIYTDDMYGNWIRMEIIPNRSYFDQYLNELLTIKRELNIYMHQPDMTFDKYYREQLKRYNYLISDGSYSGLKRLRTYSQKFIIKREITYYN